MLKHAFYMIKWFQPILKMFEPLSKNPQKLYKTLIFLVLWKQSDRTVRSIMSTYLATIEWITANIIKDEEQWIIKKILYQEYERGVTMLGLVPVNKETFGQIMKSIYPRLESRRLGSRENTSSAYVGLRKRINSLQEPVGRRLQLQAPTQEIPATRFQRLIGRFQRIKVRIQVLFQLDAQL